MTGATDLPSDESKRDRIIGTHSWNATPDPQLRPLSEPIAHWSITIVLLGSPLGDYAAYVGIGSPEWVARQGSKLTFEQARAFFPDVRAERYRG